MAEDGAGEGRARRSEPAQVRPGGAGSGYWEGTPDLGPVALHPSKDIKPLHKKPHNKEQNRTACGFSPPPAECALGMRGAWSLGMFRVHPTGRPLLAPGNRCPAPWLLRANLASPACFSCSGKALWPCPRCRPAVLRRALAKNNPALTSEAQKICCKLLPRQSRRYSKKKPDSLPRPTGLGLRPQLALARQRPGL